MDHPSGNHRRVGTELDYSGSGSGSFAFAARRGVGGGGASAPFRANPPMDFKPQWDHGLLDLESFALYPDLTTNDAAPDHPRGCLTPASPNARVNAIPGQRAMIASASSGAASTWPSAGQQHPPNIDPNHQHPTTCAQAQANPAFAGQLYNQTTQWYSRTVPQQSLNALLNAALSSGSFYSAPGHTLSLLAPTPVPQQTFANSRPVQPLQGGYEPSTDARFPSQPQPQPVNQWAGLPLSHEFLPTISAPDPGSLPARLFNTTFDDHNGTRLSSVERGPTSPPESYFALSPASGVSRDRRGSTASTELTVPDVPPDPLPPSPLGRRKHAKVPSATKFEFVLEKPEFDIGQNGNRKRVAEEPPAGATSQTLRKVSLAGKNGELQGTMMTLGHRHKKRAAFTEEKKKQTKKVRNHGVCARCKKAKKAVSIREVVV